MTALDRFFDHYYRVRPVQATFTGVHHHDASLPDWSPEGLAAAATEMAALRRSLYAHAAPGAAARTARGAGDGLSYPDGVDRLLADAFLEIQAAEQESGHFVHRNPALWTGEALFGAIALVTREFAPIETRVASAAARLRAVPAFLADARRVLRGCPESWRRRAIAECGAGVAFLREALPRWWATAGVPPGLVRTADAAADGAAAALDAFAAWLTRDAAPTDVVHVGREMLALLLRRGHFVATGPETLLAEARDALAAERARLDRLARAQAPGGWPEVEEQLARLHPPGERLMACIDQAWQACRDLAGAHDLVTWPEAPIRYVPIPEHTRGVAPHLYYLFYRSPAPFDRLPVHDYAVTPVDDRLGPDERERVLRAWNHAAIKLNHVVHHGGLGHHVQNAHAYRGASRVGQVAAVDGANRIGMFCAGTMAEGWACYACDLAEGAGFLTPLEAVAQQHTRVRLAVRAVADLELHLGLATLAQIETLYREGASMRPEAARAEAVKTSMFPGTPVMYWLGTRGLHDLRRAVGAREGAGFSFRRFHDRVLAHGSIPVPLVARLMTDVAGGTA